MTFLCHDMTGAPCCICTGDCRDGGVSKECPVCAFCTDGCVVDTDPNATNDWCCFTGAWLDEDDPIPIGVLAAPEMDDLSEEAMPIGWPRPRLHGGLPTPYIADGAEDLGHVNASRRRKVIAEHRCQVCGEVATGQVYVCARPGDTIVIDGAAVCPRCWPVALHACPHLAQLAADGELDIWLVDITTLTVERGPLIGQLSGMSFGYAVPKSEPSS